MNRRLALALIAVAASGGAASAIAQVDRPPDTPQNATPVVTTPLGLALGAALHAYGTPTTVVSKNDGNHVVFPRNWLPPGANAPVRYAWIDALIDDDATVRAIDVATDLTPAPVPLRITLDVENRSRSFTFGSYTQAQADADLADIADYSLDTARVYRLSPARQLVLVFDAQSKLLQRAIVGDRGAVSRLGFDPADLPEKTVPYTAPILQKSALPAATAGTTMAIVRYTLDRGGAIRTIDVVAPSGNPASDDSLPKRLAGDRFTPARLGGRVIASSYYRAIPR